MYGQDQCMNCGVGTYMDKTFHREEICKDCSGTETNTHSGILVGNL